MNIFINKMFEVKHKEHLGTFKNETNHSNNCRETKSFNAAQVIIGSWKLF